MTDLLDQLSDVNPVPSCDPPSIDDVWRKLDARPGEVDGDPRPDGRAASDRPISNAPIPRRHRGGLVSRGIRTLPALVAVAVCLAVVLVAVTGPRSSQTSRGGGGGSRPGWDVTGSQTPSLSALMAHFAVLRRPPTAADRAAVRRFAVGVGTSPTRTQYPTFVRLAGEANGIPVYLVVYADHRYGATGPVTGYSMHIISGSGSPYAASSYMIFPNVESSDSGTRTEYLSVVPDGVRMVRWRFACRSGPRGCVLPAGRHAVSVPVRDNLAVYPLARANPGAYYAAAVRVTWYRPDGTQTSYTNQNSAVPFPGAPAWPSSRRQPSQRHGPG
jgi:hypothetical protein